MTELPNVSFFLILGFFLILLIILELGQAIRDEKYFREQRKKEKEEG